MKSLKHSLLVTVVATGVMLGCATATAADSAGSYSVQGGRSCSKFLEAQNGNSVDSVAVSAWVGGYISAFNMMTPDTFSILGGADFGGAILWIKQYCEKNPLDSVATAMESLIVELFPKRTQRARQ